MTNQSSTGRDDLSYALVRSIFDYDPASGVLTWRHRGDRSVQWNGKNAGRPAGCLNGDGYVVVRINGRLFHAHRIIWLWMTGVEPARQIDHRDTDASNNRWANLRLATKAQNMRNRGPQRNNTSGFKGVSFDRLRGKWQATIRVDGKQYHLGRFHTKEAAYAAYKSAADRLHAEFARAE